MNSSFSNGPSPVPIEYSVQHARELQFELLSPAGGGGELISHGQPPL